MANTRIKDISTAATTLNSDDFIAVDGSTAGTRKMAKADLITEVSTGVSGTYLEESNNLSDVASKDTSKLNLEVPDVGTGPNEVPLNGQLGSMAYQSADSVSVAELEVTDKVAGTLNIATASPEAIADADADDLVIGDGLLTNFGATIATNSSGQAKINFADGAGANAARGQIKYDHQFDKLSVSTAGAERVVVDEYGRTGIGGSPSSNLHVYSSTADNLRLERDATNDWRIQLTGGALAFRDATADLERVRIDSSGRVGIANSSPGSYYSEADDLVVGAVSGDRGITVVSGTSGTGSLFFADGTSGADAYRGQIRYLHGANQLMFAVNGNEAFRIGAGGDIVMASGNGIDFGAVASGTGTVTPTTGGLLDDFETGTWSPVIAPNTGSFATATTYVYFAKYTKVGNLVTANCYIRTDGTLDTTGGSGAVQIQGLPFTSPSANDFVSVNVGYAFNWSAAPAGGYVSANTNKILLTNRISSITGNLIAGSVSDLSTAGGAKNEIMLSVTYQTT